MTHTMHKRAGFTLIEIVVAILLVGIFAAVIGPRLMDYIGRGRDKKAMIEMKALIQAIELYSAEIGAYPARLVDLVKKPAGEGAHKWRRPYIDPDKVTLVENQIVDPWNNPYRYRVTPHGGKHQFELKSEGDPQAENPAPIDAWEK